MGDFNINLLTCENHPESNDFILMLNSFFLLPYILQPTRITERSATLIDNIFANTYSTNAISGNLVSKISDHLPQLLRLHSLCILQGGAEDFRGGSQIFRAKKGGI